MGCPMGSLLSLSQPAGLWGENPDHSFFSAENAPRRRERYPKWLLAHVYHLPESELIQRQFVYAVG